MKHGNLSRTKLKIRLRRKTNPSLNETISNAMKNKAWNDIAKLVAMPTRQHTSINLDEINSKATLGDTILVPGKVLSRGDLDKKIRICALSISKSAKDKLKFSKSEFLTILEEIKKNPKAEGVKIIR
ncbi:50S ribosomal protein L18e [Candidatus Pacearchaeota archaeon]|nr:50S ribosomal protein L18e [Candidatus Pacearchaeota archaeon]